ncbi:MAG TPA: hypothetical protein VNZ52_12475 [Candidatus Thermoplasmatota archaeon]|nr:hypothetical protein [Candidatus Thermoplasmatota archaeon]
MTSLRYLPWMLAALGGLLLVSVVALGMDPAVTTTTSQGTIPFALGPGESREIVVEERWSPDPAVTRTPDGLLRTAPRPSDLPWSDATLTTALHIRPSAQPGRASAPDLLWEVTVPGQNPIQDTPEATPPPQAGGAAAEFLAGWETRAPGLTRLTLQNPSTEPAAGEVVATFTTTTVEHPGRILGVGGLLVFAMGAVWRPLFGRPPRAA